MKNTEPKNLDELQLAIERWGTERGFYDSEHGTDLKSQYLKLVEEVGEIAKNLARGKDITDDIGDTGVVLIGLAKLAGTNFKDCLLHAYDEIKDRKGTMRKGVFIKSEDL